jgi:hypothetical protein
MGTHPSRSRRRLPAGGEPNVDALTNEFDRVRARVRAQVPGQRVVVMDFRRASILPPELADMLINVLHGPKPNRPTGVGNPCGITTAPRPRLLLANIPFASPGAKVAGEDALSYGHRSGTGRKRAWAPGPSGIDQT